MIACIPNPFAGATRRGISEQVLKYQDNIKTISCACNGVKFKKTEVLCCQLLRILQAVQGSHIDSQGNSGNQHSNQLETNRFEAQSQAGAQARTAEAQLELEREVRIEADKTQRARAEADALMARARIAEAEVRMMEMQFRNANVPLPASAEDLKSLHLSTPEMPRGPFCARSGTGA